MTKIIDLTLVAALSCLPLYFWSSGGLQLSHYLMCFACILFILKFGINYNNGEKLLIVLGLYVLIREGVSVIVGANPKGLLSSLYIIFSFSVLNLTRRWIEHDKHVALLRLAVIFACCISLIGILTLGVGLTVDSEGGRAVGTFNNPNQLGYFSVCIFSIASLLFIRGQIRPPTLILLVASSIFFSIASLSKAAMISISFAAIFLGFTRSRSKHALVAGTVFALFIIAAIVLAAHSEELDHWRFVQRLAGIGNQDDDSLEGRGYYVLFQMNAVDFIFGFGSQMVMKLVGHEVHSTYASFFANYGIIGGMLFTALLYTWARNLYIRDGLKALFVVAAPPLLFGISHNGSRFTIFWVLLGLSFATLPSQIAQARSILQGGPASSSSMRQ